MGVIAIFQKVVAPQFMDQAWKLWELIDPVNDWATLLSLSDPAPMKQKKLPSVVLSRAALARLSAVISSSE